MYLQGDTNHYVLRQEEYLLELSRYIHLNPVSVGLSEKPEGYRWSSYATQGWEIKENCGFEGCYPLVDYLKGEDISIRFDLFNTVHDAKGEHFSIRLTFDAPIDKICTYNPTNTILIYKRKRISPYRYVTHGTTKIDSNENRIIPFERYSTKIPRYESNSLLVLLFFSVENIPPNETFSLKIMILCVMEEKLFHLLLISKKDCGTDKYLVYNKGIQTDAE